MTTAVVVRSHRWLSREGDLRLSEVETPEGRQGGNHHHHAEAADVIRTGARTLDPYDVALLGQRTWTVRMPVVAPVRTSLPATESRNL